MSLPANKNIDIDVTDYWDFRVKALLEHRSQIGTPDVFMQRMKDRRDQSPQGPDCYVEYFRRIVFRK